MKNKPTRKQIAAFIRKCMEERRAWADSEEGRKTLGPGSPMIPGLYEYEQILRYVEQGDTNRVWR